MIGGKRRDGYSDNITAAGTMEQDGGGDVAMQQQQIQSQSQERHDYNYEDRDDGWQDKADFERQQEVVQGEIGKRDNAVGGGFEEGEEGGYVPRVKTTIGPREQKARKAAKKERRKRDQKEVAERRQREREES